MLAGHNVYIVTWRTPEECGTLYNLLRSKVIGIYATSRQAKEKLIMNKVIESWNTREGWYVGKHKSKHVRIQQCVWDNKPPTRSEVAQHKGQMFSAGTFKYLGATISSRSFE
jgi:hypothetical protein